MKHNLKSIVDALEQIQNEGGPKNFVIFTIPTYRSYYILCVGKFGSSKLYAEAVSNDLLEPEFMLNKDQLSQLRSLGWHFPQSPWNPYQKWHIKSEENRVFIAKKIIQTFTEVYGLVAEQFINAKLVLSPSVIHQLQPHTSSEKDMVNNIADHPVEEIGHLILQDDDFEIKMPVAWKVEHGELEDGKSWKVNIKYEVDKKLLQNRRYFIGHYLHNLQAILKIQPKGKASVSCGVEFDEPDDHEDFYMGGVFAVHSPYLGRSYRSGRTFRGNILPPPFIEEID